MCRTFTYLHLHSFIFASFTIFRRYKDVAFVSLANILHQSHYSNEAAIVVHAALDVSNELTVNHFTLGNIYAV